MAESTKFTVLDAVTASVAIDKTLGYDKAKNKTVMLEVLSGSAMVEAVAQVTPDEVIEVIDWGREQKGNDFFYSLRDILSKEEITSNQFGFIACLPFLKRQAEGREAQKQELAKTTANSEWIGKVGKRSEFFVKLTSKRFLNNYDSWIYSTVTKEGNLGVFFSQKDFEIVEGDCFVMKATPKRHQISNFHGGKETMFNRVVLKEVVGQKENTI